MTLINWIISKLGGRHKRMGGSERGQDGYQKACATQQA